MSKAEETSIERTYTVFYTFNLIKTSNESKIFGSLKNDFIQHSKPFPTTTFWCQCHRKKLINKKTDYQHNSSP